METKIKEFEERIRKLEDKALVDNVKEKQSTERWQFIFRNWRVLVFCTLLVFGAYEAFKYVLYLQPPIK